MKYIHTLLFSLLIGYSVVSQEWNSTGNNTTTGSVFANNLLINRGLLSESEVDEAKLPGVYKVSYSGHSQGMLDISGLGGSTPRFQLKAKYDDRLFYRAARDSESNWDNKGFREVVLVNEEGNVGIGTVTPTTGLEVKNDLGIAVQSSTKGGWLGTIKMADGFQNTTWRDDMLFSTHGGFMFKMDEGGNGISNGGNGVVGFNIYNRSNESVFAVQESTGNVGIGTTSPTTKLEVAGVIKTYTTKTNQYLKLYGGNSGNFIDSYGTDFYLRSEANNAKSIVLKNSGEVGIGTSSPKMKLEVKDGDFGILGLNTSRYFRFTENAQNQGAFINYDGTNNILNIGVHEAANVDISNDKNSISIVRSTGNVGIGTTEPKNKLSVNGTIWATKVKVMLTDAADWVFEDDYKLRTLNEVAEFIKKNKHLPEMPSADEFRANDMEVSEMTNKLLQKIEELTLYTIAQEKQIEEFKAYKNAQDKKIKLLIERMEALEAK